MIVAEMITSFATAIFRVAKTKEEIEKYYQQIASLDALNNTNFDFYRILAARSIDKDERKELAQTVLSSYGFEPKVIYWVWTIIDKNFYHRFHYIAQTCREIYQILFKVTRVKITSAHELSEAQMDTIKNFFEKKLKLKIDIAWHIKPDLIGGLRIQVNNKSYNNTYRIKLESLKKQLLSRKDDYGN